MARARGGGVTDRTPCDHCGMALYPDDAFCPGCGESIAGVLPPAAPQGRRSARIRVALESGAHAFIRSCSRCGGEVLPGDAFCQMCGSRQTPA